jgi:hypothetical protein
MSNKLIEKDTITQRDSFSELVGQLANNSATVVHDEIELFVQGIREKITAGRNGVITVVIGSGIGFTAFMCFCVVLIVGLTSYMSLIMASLATGVALSLIGAIIAFVGYRKLKKSMHGA